MLSAGKNMGREILFAKELNSVQVLILYKIILKRLKRKHGCLIHAINASFDPCVLVKSQRAVRVKRKQFFVTTLTF